MKLYYSLLLLMILGITQLNWAQETVHPSLLNTMSNVFGVTVEGGATFGMTDYQKSKIDYNVGASLEYYFPSHAKGNIGLMAFGQTGFVDGRIPPSEVTYPTDRFHTKIDLLGGAIFYTISINDIIYPRASFGLSNIWFTAKAGDGQELPYNSTGTYSRYMLAFNGNLGVRFMLTKNMSINLDGGIIVGKNDYLDNVKVGNSNDMLYTANAGISYYFGRLKDSDGDGVPDSRDMCPNTPLNVKVDEFGCPLDSDGDGVPDYLDKCPNTPTGVKVDATGCPLDSDGDGVPDYLDKCPNTPTGVKVDVNGCPLDSDGDGVPDYLDKCPNTPMGVQVDADGCPIKKETVIIVQPKEIESVVLNGDANFEFNKSVLLPNAYPVLDSLVSTMLKHHDYKWEIGGYTDGIGSVNYNIKLSQRRAQAVVDYLVSKGVDRNNLKVVGYGKANPIATNDTPEGRSMNRRVEIKVISKNNQ
jgi:outer membrane protein OmpA-like peptidoglycan-associated protein